MEIARKCFFLTNPFKGMSLTIIKYGMLQHSFVGAVIFLSLQHFITPALDYMPCLRRRREEIKAFNPRREHSIAAKKDKFLPQINVVKKVAFT